MAAPLRVGVVGLGIRGFWIAYLAQTGPETALVALADMNPEMLDIAREKFPGAALYESGEAMAARADIEAVFVGTGDRFHAGNAREALQHGRHVRIEKPLAQSFEDLQEIARLQRETGLVVGTFLELRHSTLWRRVKAIIASGEVGQILAGSLVDHVGRDEGQFFGRSKSRSKDVIVSLVLQKGVHGLDLLNWFIGSTPTRLSAVGGLRYFGGNQPAHKRCLDCADRDTCRHVHGHIGRLNPPGIEIDHGDDTCVWSEACDVEDVSFVNIEYASGATGSYHEVHFAPYYAMHFTLYGTKAQLDIEANHDTGQAWVQVTERYTRNQRRERPTRDTGHGGADPALIADFAQAIREGREPLCGLRAGFESAVIGIGARHALDTKSVVELPMLSEP